MRRRLFSIIGALAVFGLLATPVSAAPPVENEWGDIIGGRAFSSCTGEFFDDNGRVHSVVKENASPEPSVHINLHLEAVGESSGDVYVYNTTINSPVHVAADGSYTADQLVNFVLVSRGQLAQHADHFPPPPGIRLGRHPDVRDKRLLIGLSG